MLDLITSWNTNTLLSKTKTPDYAFPYNYCHTVTRNRGNPSGHRWKLLSESGKCTQTATGTVEQWQQSMFCRRPLLVLWATWPDDGRPDWQPDQPSSPERAALQQWPMSKGNEWATDVAWGPEVMRPWSPSVSSCLFPLQSAAVLPNSRRFYPAALTACSQCKAVTAGFVHNIQLTVVWCESVFE